MKHKIKYVLNIQLNTGQSREPASSSQKKSSKNEDADSLSNGNIEHVENLNSLNNSLSDLIPQMKSNEKGNNQLSDDEDFLGFFESRVKVIRELIEDKVS